MFDCVFVSIYIEQNIFFKKELTVLLFFLNFYWKYILHLLMVAEADEDLKADDESIFNKDFTNQ